MKRALFAIALAAVPLTACAQPVHHHWYGACYRAVEAQIPSPHPDYYNARHTGTEADEVVEVIGMVSAENLYGDEVASSYTCLIRPSDRTVIDLKIDRIDLFEPPRPA